MLTVAFAYVVPYAGYRGGTGQQALDPPLTADFAGALALILGVLVAGSEYALDTWKTILVQRPSRIAVFSGKLAALAVACLVLVVTLLAVSAASSVVVTAIEGAAATWPPATEILADLAAGWLIGFMWAALGVALAIGLRAVALPVGIGLVWILAIQNLITGLAAPLLTWVDAAQAWLPGPAAGSLITALGARRDTPGVTELIGSTQATLIIAGYLVAFAVFARTLMRQRDLT